MTRERSGSEDRHPGASDRMTPLERSSRRLLRVYPSAYRRERGDEIIGTLVEASADRNWPRIRDVRALAVGGLQARSAQNRQRTTSANLRIALMAGLAMYLSVGIAAYLVNVAPGLITSSQQFPGWPGWPAAMVPVLSGATIVLAWTAPRRIVIAAALAASAAVISAWFANGQLGARTSLAPVALIALAALAPRAGHPSRRWLWLPVLIVVSWEPLQLSVSHGLLGYTWGLPPALPLLAFVVGGILWVCVDARLIAAVLTFFALIQLQRPVDEIWSGVPGAVPGSLPYLLAVAALSAPAVWLLRRQSARLVR